VLLSGGPESDTLDEAKEAVTMALDRATAIVAVGGGICWIAAWIYRSTLPRGCVGDECLSRPMRGDTALGVTLQIVAAIMILAAGIGLVIHIQRRGQLGRLGVAGVCSCVVGVALLVAAGFVPATVFGRGIDAVPFFVIPGVALLAIGALLVAVVVIRSRVLPRWAGYSLLICAGMLLLANEQTAAVLFAVPFGIAWILVGAALWRDRNAASAFQSASPGVGGR
jgi:hypothetical protein